MNPAARHDLARLRAALDYPDHGAAPDVPAIIARGRRARARRRLLESGGVAALVAATVAAVVLLVPAAGPAGPPIAAPDPAVVAALHGGPAPAVLVPDGIPLDAVPDRFDPLTRTLDVGWLPEGLDGGAVMTGLHEQMYSAADDAYVNGGPDVGLLITVLSRGRSVAELPEGGSGLPRDAQPRPTDPVGGGTAVCLSDPLVPAGTCSALRWQYAPGAWAQVSYAGSAGPTPESAAAVVRRVAESVSLSEAEPVRLPFTLSGRLAGLVPLSTWVAVSDDVDPTSGTRWSVQVRLAIDGDDAAVDAAAVDFDAPQVTVWTSWTPGGEDPGSSKDGPPNTTVDGHPAALDEYRPRLTVWDVQGCTVSVSDPRGPEAAFGDLRIADDPADPNGWPAAR
jgi:hypothetical protein